tara:strand:+ start:26 stop:127 length:102 start_codon:yes stop_codon:yes gene_type:complete
MQKKNTLSLVFGFMNLNRNLKHPARKKAGVAQG